MLSISIFNLHVAHLYLEQATALSFVTTVFIPLAVHLVLMLIDENTSTMNKYISEQTLYNSPASQFYANNRIKQPRCIYVSA